MNAFTKNELEIIRNSLGMATYEACEESGFDILYDKIRSMIDNYCEHHERTYDRKTGQRICPHCDDYFGDNADEIENRLLGYLNE